MGPVGRSATAVVGVVMVLVLGGFAGGSLGGSRIEPRGGPNEWTNVTPAQSPSPRFYHSVAYDSVRSQVVLFGGVGTGWRFLNDTWVFDVNSNTWTQVTPTLSPPAMGGHPNLVYDSAADRVLLMGMGDVWAYDPASSSWTRRSAGSGASNQREFAIAYDPSADRTILFGGGTWAPHYWGLGSNETWIYDYTANAWSRANTFLNPPSRFGSGMTYDSAMGRVVLFGGCSEPSTDFTCTPANDTWAYDYGGSTWLNLNPVTSPPPMNALTYDSGSDRLILFGDGDHTWTYDRSANRWTDQNPAVSPPPRDDHAMVYASALARVVLVGGSWNQEIRADTWTYEYGAFVPTVPGAPRSLGAAPGSHRVDLQWQPPASNGGYSISGYRVYRGIPPASPAFLVDVGAVRAYEDSGLTTGVTYEYQVSALNVLGEGARSSPVTSTPPDTIGPAIAILSPEANATVTSRLVNVTGTAYDDIAIEKVELSTDYETWILANGTTSWFAELTLHEGRNRIWARATDTSGNPWLTSLNVTVDSGRRDVPAVVIWSAAGIVVLGLVVAVTWTQWRRGGRRERVD